MKIKEIYKEHCKKYDLNLEIVPSVKSYDNTTLFCPAGMQQFKKEFINESYHNTIVNIQPCLRMNDFEEIGDSTHLLYFNMLGFFSFREESLDYSINFWLDFLKRLDLKPDYVTIHPDKENDLKWTSLYNYLEIDIKLDKDCIWKNDGISGYCTEFYINDIEIGNIVNPLGNCIDAGFGLERLDLIVNNKLISKVGTLKESCYKIIKSGFKPSNTKQGYVLRKLLRELYNLNETLEHPFFRQEINRQVEIKKTYNRLKDKHSDKSKEWWYESLGIKIDEL